MKDVALVALTDAANEFVADVIATLCHHRSSNDDDDDDANEDASDDLPEFVF